MKDLNIILFCKSYILIQNLKLPSTLHRQFTAKSERIFLLILQLLCTEPLNLVVYADFYRKKLGALCPAVAKISQELRCWYKLKIWSKSTAVTQRCKRVVKRSKTYLSNSIFPKNTFIKIEMYRIDRNKYNTWISYIMKPLPRCIHLFLFFMGWFLNTTTRRYYGTNNKM